MTTPDGPGTGAFLSGDWGTSRLRLRLIDAGDLAVLAGVESEAGIARTHAAWEAAGAAGADRERYFLDVLGQDLHRLSRASGRDLAGLTLVLSGMASSSLGVRPLPYGRLPWDLRGEVPPIEQIGPGVLPVETILVSGLGTHGDVMRGEETILLGLADLGLGDGLYLLPGTHSKHVVVRDGAVVDFRTYMTGEVYALLRERSVLREALAGSAWSGEAFERGVAEARSIHLLHEPFTLRAASLQGRGDEAGGAARLSGWLIGSELADLAADDAPGLPINLAAAEPLLSHYRTALERLGLGVRVQSVPAERFASIVARGQRVLWRRHRAPK